MADRMRSTSKTVELSSAGYHRGLLRNTAAERDRSGRLEGYQAAAGGHPLPLAEGQTVEQSHCHSQCWIRAYAWW